MAASGDGPELKFDALGQKIDAMELKLNAEIDGLRSDFRTIKWMLVGVLALLYPMFLRTCLGWP